MLKVYLDPEQKEILRAIQNEPMVSVKSGTARGKDFVIAVACICFLYLTPKWGKNGELIENTKVAMTAPTDRQIGNIMFPEISRIFNRVQFLPGRLVGYDIRTDQREWFLTGFKADDKSSEAWSGFHAVHTMFAVTEATGISELTYQSIEGNLQGDSRIVLVYNPNISTGYAAQSQRSPRWKKFTLDSLTAPNVLQKRDVIPGQVNYEWVEDKVRMWCTQIDPRDFNDDEGDFYFELDGVKKCFRPNDLFRVKVRGLFPKVSHGALVPREWILAANERWKAANASEYTENNKEPLRLGLDIAGMGRDSSCFCPRHGNYVKPFVMIHSAGAANHMQVVGIAINMLRTEINKPNKPHLFIDTIGEGAAVYSRAVEIITEKQKHIEFKDFQNNIHSVKFSESPEFDGEELKDATEQYSFMNMRAWLAWAIRDWLDPKFKSRAMLPPDEELEQELTETQWEFISNGSIRLEPKDDIKTRIKRSPDKFDSLANTFYPIKIKEEVFNYARLNSIL